MNHNKKRENTWTKYTGCPSWTGEITDYKVADRATVTSPIGF